MVKKLLGVEENGFKEHAFGNTMCTRGIPTG